MSAQGRKDTEAAKLKWHWVRLTHRPMPDSAIHLLATIIGEADSIQSRMRASLAPAQPVLRILDRLDPLATLAAVR
jgi:hypothetical protein